MTHSTAILFAHLGNWLLGLPENSFPERQPKSPVPVARDAERERLPLRDEGFYWAWQYWSQ